MNVETVRTDPTSTTDALIEVAGRLTNLGNISVVDPPHHDGPTGTAGAPLGPDDPLTPAEFDTLGGNFAVFAHNLEGLVDSLLNFDNLNAGRKLDAR